MIFYYSNIKNTSLLCIQSENDRFDYIYFNNKNMKLMDYFDSGQLYKNSKNSPIIEMNTKTLEEIITKIFEYEFGL